MHVNWFKDPDNVVYCKEEEVLPRLSKELGIGDLAERVGLPRGARSGGDQPQGAPADNAEAVRP